MQHRSRPLNFMIFLSVAFVMAGLLTLPTGTRSDDLSSQTPLYTLTAIPPLPGKAVGFFPMAINDNGEVVGEGQMRVPSMTVAFLYGDGKTTELKPSVLRRDGAVHQSMKVDAISDQGQIAGSVDSSVSSSSIYHACLMDEATPSAALALTERVTPDAPAYPESLAIDMNNAGEVAGQLYTAAAITQACVWRRGRLFLLGTLGGPQSFSAAINNQNQVVGTSELNRRMLFDGYARHAYMWTYNGGMRDLGTLGGSISNALAINNSGVIVGDSTLIADVPTPIFHACFWQQGKIYDLGSARPGLSTIATGINDSGDIVGVMQTPVTAKQPYALWDACLWHKGHLYDLNDITAQDGTWGLRSANEDQLAFSPFYAFINNQGQITGYGMHGDKLEGYLLTPTATAGPKLSSWFPQIPTWSRRRDRPCPDSREIDRRDAGQDRDTS